MVARQISFFLVLLGAVVVTESFAVVRFWRQEKSQLEENGEHNHTSISNGRETKRKELDNNTVLIIVWTSIGIMFLVACGLIFLNKRNISIRRVKDLLQKDAKIDNSPCRFNATENPLYSIKWGLPLPTIPEENADDYVAVTGYLTFHRPRPKHGNLHKSSELTSSKDVDNLRDVKTQPSLV